MEHDEIADAFQLALRLIVEAIGQRGVDAAERERLDQPRHAGHDRMDAGRFERFDEAARKAERDAILVPDLAAAPGAETDQARLGDELSFEPLEQEGMRLVVGHVIAAIDETVADAGLERDAPLPSPLVRHRAGVRNGSPDRMRLDRQRAIGRQPLGPWLEPGLERLLDQNAARLRAIDEQVTLDRLPGFQLERLDEAAFRILPHVRDLAFDALHARLLGQLAQEPGIERGIEMIVIAERPALPGVELAGLGRLELEAVI